MASLGHTGRRVVLGHPLNTQTLMKTDEQHNNRKVLSKLTILCWAAFIAILGSMQPAGRGLDATAREFCLTVIPDYCGRRSLISDCLAALTRDKHRTSLCSDVTGCLITWAVVRWFSFFLSPPYEARGLEDGGVTCTYKD